MSGLAAGTLCFGGRCRGVAVRGLARLLECGGALLLLVRAPLAGLGGRAQRPDEVGCGRAPGGQCGRRVPFGLTDGYGDARGTVGRRTVTQYGLGCLPGRVERPRVGQFPALRRRGLLGDGECQGGVPVGEFGGDQRAASPDLLGLGDGVGGGGDLLGQVGGPAAFLGGARGEPAGERAGTALGARVDVPGPRPGFGGFDDPAEQIGGARGEVPFGGELRAAAEFVAEAGDEVGQAVRVTGVGDGPQQQVREVGVLLHREETGRLPSSAFISRW